MGGTIWIMLCLVLFRVMAADFASDPSVQLFQEYIQINTTTHNDLTEAVEFWRSLAASEDLPFNVYEYEAGYPVIVIKWAGTDCSQYSIMLNSHMDVVPANVEEGWTYEPFSGHIDANGDIYGRGTQDMKSVSIQYFEALRRLKDNNVQFIRDVYMTLMPDEEVGGEYGMKQFLNSEKFAAMNIGVELDEGSAYPLPVVPVFYQDKVPWQIQVDCYGEAAHGSSLPDTNSTATGKCNNVINQMLKFRDEQLQISKSADITNAGIYTSVNLNKLNGGTANNVIPNHVSLVFDIRLSTTLNETEFQAKLDGIIADSGDNIEYSFIVQRHQSPATRVDSTNPYWDAILAATKSIGLTVVPTIPPGSTDASYVRLAGIPAFGLSPMPNTAQLLHSVNERVNAKIFLQGIDIYEKIIENLANIPGVKTAEDPSTYIVYTVET